uniref:Uncharacterized protein n=1 Tax=Mastacembelus armatus TaxID=205130 RepID=A0A7N8YIN9_9TELE
MNLRVYITHSCSFINCAAQFCSTAVKFFSYSTYKTDSKLQVRFYQTETLCSQPLLVFHDYLYFIFEAASETWRGMYPILTASLLSQHKYKKKDKQKLD